MPILRRKNSEGVSLSFFWGVITTVGGLFLGALVVIAQILNADIKEHMRNGHAIYVPRDELRTRNNEQIAELGKAIQEIQQNIIKLYENDRKGREQYGAIQKDIEWLKRNTDSREFNP